MKCRYLLYLANSLLQSGSQGLGIFLDAMAFWEVRGGGLGTCRAPHQGPPCSPASHPCTTGRGECSSALLRVQLNLGGEVTHASHKSVDRGTRVPHGFCLMGRPTFLPLHCAASWKLFPTPLPLQTSSAHDEVSRRAVGWLELNPNLLGDKGQQSLHELATKEEQRWVSLPENNVQPVVPECPLCRALR